MVGSINCPSCSSAKDVNAQFCRSCGKSLADGSIQLADKGGFDIWWMLGGVGVILGVLLGAGFLLGLAGVTLGSGGLALVGFGGYALGGFLVGRFSKSKTIIEPAISAVIAVAISMLLLGRFTVIGLLVGAVIPFLAALLGGWLGEKAQGTI